MAPGLRRGRGAPARTAVDRGPARRSRGCCSGRKRRSPSRCEDSADRQPQRYAEFERLRATRAARARRCAADRRDRAHARATAGTSTAPTNSVFVLGAGRPDPRPLRQGASRPLWRISADAAAAVGDRPVAPGAGRRRFHRRARARARIDLPATGARSASSSATRSSSRARSSTARNRPDFIFNPSNDAWFGRWGPPQHLAQARLRAAEEGLPVIRSTPTGISARDRRARQRRAAAAAGGRPA